MTNLFNVAFEVVAHSNVDNYKPYSLRFSTQLDHNLWDSFSYDINNHINLGVRVLPFSTIKYVSEQEAVGGGGALGVGVGHGGECWGLLATGYRWLVAGWESETGERDAEYVCVCGVVEKERERVCSTILIHTAPFAE